MLKSLTKRRAQLTFLMPIHRERHLALFADNKTSSFLTRITMHSLTGHFYITANHQIFACWIFSLIAIGKTTWGSKIGSVEDMTKVSQLNRTPNQFLRFSECFKWNFYELANFLILQAVSIRMCPSRKTHQSIHSFATSVPVILLCLTQKIFSNFFCSRCSFRQFLVE